MDVDYDAEGLLNGNLGHFSFVQDLLQLGLDVSLYIAIKLRIER